MKTRKNKLNLKKTSITRLDRKKLNAVKGGTGNGHISNGDQQGSNKTTM